MSELDRSDAAFGAAEKFYFDHLRRMLVKNGQIGAQGRLKDHMRLYPVDAETKGAYQVLKLKLTQKLTGYTLQLNAVTGEVLSWYVDFLSAFGDQSMSVDEATTLAEQTANPPADAHLRIHAYETVGDRVYFRAFWTHEYNGLPVEGDFIEVLINAKANRPFSYTRIWHTPDLTGNLVER